MLVSLYIPVPVGALISNKHVNVKKNLSGFKYRKQALSANNTPEQTIKLCSKLRLRWCYTQDKTLPFSQLKYD